jgi:transcriptional regulator with XRE-family HTH domain
MAKQPREKTAETLGANVRYLREHASVSQTELARRMAERGWPWHQATVYRVETGKQPVRFDEALDLADLLGVTLDRLTWAIGEAAEEELATFALTSLRERIQEAAVAIARLRIARVVAESRAKAAADSDYPHIRKLASGIEQDLQAVNLGTVLALSNVLWRRYRQGIETDPGGNVPIWDDLHANTRLHEALQHIDETYDITDEDSDDLDQDFIRKEDP